MIRSLITFFLINKIFTFSLELIVPFYIRFFLKKEDFNKRFLLKLNVAAAAIFIPDFL